MNVVKSRLRKMGEDIRGVPEGRPTNHVLGSMEACSSIGLDVLLYPDLNLDGMVGCSAVG